MQAIIGKDFPKIVIPLINNAKKNIKIVVFDWRWYPNDSSSPVQQFNQSLVSAVRRGVHIHAVANNNEIVGILQGVGIDAKKFVSKNIVHAKLMIIDDEIVVIGSHNYTQYAFTMNFEVSCVIDNAEIASEYAKFFNSLYL